MAHQVSAARAEFRDANQRTPSSGRCCSGRSGRPLLVLILRYISGRSRRPGQRLANANAGWRRVRAADVDARGEPHAAVLGALEEQVVGLGPAGGGGVGGGGVGRGVGEKRRTAATEQHERAVSARVRQREFRGSCQPLRHHVK